MLPFVIIAAIVAFAVVYLISVYNGLASLKVKIKEAWSHIDVQLKRRVDLIPNLVETVKGYAAHEKEVFEQVTNARAALMSAKNPEQAGQADNMLSGALKSLFAIAEAYPELKASENFGKLQDELTDTENKVAAARQFYNSVVRDFNSKLVVFPTNMIGSMFGFREEQFFEATEEERKSIKVDFSTQN